jgi:hypothetical protein
VASPRPSPRRPNSGQPARLPRNLAVRVETGSTDRTLTRARWSSLSRVLEKAPSGPRNPVKRAARMRSWSRCSMPSKFSDAQKNRFETTVSTDHQSSPPSEKWRRG